MEARERASDRLETVRAAFLASAELYDKMGARLYSVLCRQAAAAPELLALAAHGQAAARAMHLLSSVHYLLLQDPRDPLARFFATLTPHPAPAEEAFPDLLRFCQARRAEILDLLRTRTVQTTFVERCRALVAPMAYVADRAGEPLNLIEIGCSAGVLLTFDKYAYELNGQGRIGPAGAPLVLQGEVRGGSELRIPRVGSRIGIDLHPVDVRSEAERRWLLALCFPEFREQQARLATALDEVCAAGIQVMQGDGLELVPRALAQTADPVCVFHSACLFYWSAEAREALDARLREASLGRQIWRIGIEPTDSWNAWNKGETQSGTASGAGRPSGGVTVWRYSAGAVESRFVARNSSDYGSLEWIDAGA
jgi:hypothetical protein